MQKIAIAGFGREGRSTLAFLRHSSQYPDSEIWVLDRVHPAGVPRGVRIQSGKNYLADLSKFDIIFRTPGFPYNAPEIQRALKAGVIVSSATKLFFNEIKKLFRPPLIIGITGTKGKGTTATLLYKMLSAARKNVFLGGNIGTSPLELLPKLAQAHGKEPATVILELSSFQLQDLDISPHIAVVLNIFPDHQDAHKNLREYYAAKANIARFQSARDMVFFFKHQPLSRGIAKNGYGKKMAVDESKFRLFKPEDLAMPGYHNFKNAVMAATVARTLRVPETTIMKVAKRFRGNEHRLEFVRRIHNITFFNDSASTNPQTSAAAIQAFPGSSRVLIAGGQDKKLDYAPLARAIKESRVKTVVLLGENKAKILRTIRSVLADFGIPAVLAKNLSSAVGSAYLAARRIEQRSKGLPIVLFSPGAASFDMFKNYADRGAQFKAIVKKLK